MALSNIFREPRREIVETLVGVAAISVPVWLDYRFAVWFQEMTSLPNSLGCPLPVGMFFGLILAVLGAIVLVTVHTLGDLVCGALQNIGIHLRPRQRY